MVAGEREGECLLVSIHYSQSGCKNGEMMQLKLVLKQAILTAR